MQSQYDRSLGLSEVAFNRIQGAYCKNKLNYVDVVDFFERFLETCAEFRFHSEVGLRVTGYMDGGCDTRGGMYADFCTAVEFEESGYCDFYRKEARPRVSADNGIEVIRVHPSEAGARFSSARGWDSMKGAFPVLEGGAVRYEWVKRINARA